MLLKYYQKHFTQVLFHQKRRKTLCPNLTGCSECSRLCNNVNLGCLNQQLVEQKTKHAIFNQRPVSMVHFNVRFSSHSKCKTFSSFFLPWKNEILQKNIGYKFLSERFLLQHGTHHNSFAWFSLKKRGRVTP